MCLKQRSKRYVMDHLCPSLFFQYQNIGLKTSYESTDKKHKNCEIKQHQKNQLRLPTWPLYRITWFFVPAWQIRKMQAKWSLFICCNSFWSTPNPTFPLGSLHKMHFKKNVLSGNSKTNKHDIIILKLSVYYFNTASHIMLSYYKILTKGSDSTFCSLRYCFLNLVPILY